MDLPPGEIGSCGGRVDTARRRLSTFTRLGVDVFPALSPPDLLTDDMGEKTMSTDFKLLIVEDEEAILRLLEILFRRFGYEVICCRSGLEALETFVRESADLVITDIRMPGLDGIDLAHEVRKIAPGTPVLFISGSLDDRDVISRLDHELEANPQSNFLRKPFNINDILMKADMLLRRTRTAVS